MEKSYYYRLNRSSGWFDCTEPSLSTSLQGKQGVQGTYALVRGSSSPWTFSNHIIEEITRCVEFFHMSLALFQPNALLLTFRLLFCSLHQSIHNSDSCHFMRMRSSITMCVCAKMRVWIIVLLIAFGWATGKLLIKEFVYLKRKPDLEYLVVNLWGSRALLLLGYALTVHSPSSHVNNALENRECMEMPALVHHVNGCSYCIQKLVLFHFNRYTILAVLLQPGMHDCIGVLGSTSRWSKA